MVSSFDDAEAASTTLLRAESEAPCWIPDRQVVLRHHLLLPPDAIDDAIAVAAQDGYAPGDAAGTELPTSTVDGSPLTLQRVQILDALHCSQERSRMAGLAQRRDGQVLGWDALQPDPGARENDR